MGRSAEMFVFGFAVWLALVAVLGLIVVWAAFGPVEF